MIVNIDGFVRNVRKTYGAQANEVLEQARILYDADENFDGLCIFVNGHKRFFIGFKDEDTEKYVAFRQSPRIATERLAREAIGDILFGMKDDEVFEKYNAEDKGWE